MSSWAAIAATTFQFDVCPLWNIPKKRRQRGRKRQKKYTREREREREVWRRRSEWERARPSPAPADWLAGSRVYRERDPFAFCVFFYINGSVTGAAFLVTKRCAAVTFQFTTVVTNAVVSSFFFIFSTLTLSLVQTTVPEKNSPPFPALFIPPTEFENHSLCL